MGLCGWAPLVCTVKEELNSRVTQLADVSQPPSSPTQRSYSGCMHRAARTAEAKACAWTQQHTHDGCLS